MAMIIHRCDCTHPDYFHEHGVCSHKQCPCRDATLNPEPEVVLTWDGSTQLAVEALTPPGTEWNAGNRHQVTTCDCPACRSLYDSLDGVAA